MSREINSKKYWEEHFKTKLETYREKKRTEYFMQLIIENLPENVKKYIDNRDISILDWGCALGQGVNLLQNRFPNAKVKGLDFSETAIKKAKSEYSDLNFTSESLSELNEKFSVITCSNCLEHFADPSPCFQEHLAHTKDIYVALVPYKEENCIEGHEIYLNEDFFPDQIEAFRKIYSKILDTRPSGFWYGYLLLIVYVRKSLNLDNVNTDYNILIDSQSPELWDNVAETYSEIANEAEIKLGQEIEQLFLGLGIEPGSSLLEVGCGSGHLSGYLAGKGFKTTLIDFSKIALEKAKKYYEQNNQTGNFVSANMFDLSTDLVGSHDVVWNSGVFEHFGAWDVLAVLKRMARISRKYVLVLVPNAKSIPYLLFRQQAMRKGEWIWGRELLRDSMRHFAEAAGLEVIEEQYVGEHFSKDHFNYASLELRAKYQDIEHLITQKEKNYLIAMIARPKNRSTTFNYEKIIENVLKEESKIEADTYYFDFHQFKYYREENHNKIGELQDFTVNLKFLLEERNSKISELQSLCVDFKSQIEEFSNEVANLKDTLRLEVENRDLKIETLRLEIEKRDFEIETFGLEIENKGLEIKESEEILQQVKNSVSWRLGQLYENFIPYNSKTTKLLRIGIDNFLSSLDKNGKHIKNSVDVLQNEGITGVVERATLKIPLNAKVKFNPYDRLLFLKPIIIKVIDKNYSTIYDKIKFSVVLPVKNEGENLSNIFSSIENQSLKPDELIIIEHGSIDNTVQEIEKFMRNYSGKTHIRLVQPTIKSLSCQRNKGILEAIHEYIILVDACDIPPNLFTNLLGPISEDPSVDLVSAIFYAKQSDNPYWHNKFIWNWNDLDFNNFLPSAKALLIKKDLFEKVSGFPEFLDYTGEDTLFGIKYQKISKKWVINKAAFVFWDAASTKDKAHKKAYSYGKGDGESGFGDFSYYEPLVISLHGGKQHFTDPITESYFNGYLEGRSNRVKNLVEKKELQGNFLILSGVPFTDSGGGQRGTQITLELMKKKHKVTFCNVYPSFENENKVFLDIEHQLLELYCIDDFSIDDYIERHKLVMDQTVILLEFPHPNFIPYVKRLKSVNPKVKVVYDCIDNWYSTLGWIWYSKDKELEIIDLSDLIITSAKTLLERLKSMTDKEIYLIPNSVNTRLFNPCLNYEKPLDLPCDGRQIVIYTGALWGKWFDWSLLEYIAVNLLDVEFIIIGNIPYDHSEYMKLKNYKNIYFLGLKNQFDLPKYLYYCNVCIVPFVYDKEIIKYTNPLKVYEYLAMNKPVVSTFMDEIVDFPGVFLSKDHNTFLSNLKNALNIPPNNSNYSDFIYENSWTKRIEVLEKIILPKYARLFDIDTKPLVLDEVTESTSFNTF
jgi:2-polyprenyl-3-methyl-5-hydroxy-6-metoxy-1,4-benzoquinol methylase/glycosyltransferase involved in cell wall biosynthesis